MMFIWISLILYPAHQRDDGLFLKRGRTPCPFSFRSSEKVYLHRDFDFQTTLFCLRQNVVPNWNWKRWISSLSFFLIG
ncbi:hypothetical protein A6J88_02640 [Neisseria mucosa]|uniref:Uncharacterized protein n=1 Tax=Neisseria mucosa TaxID=488 RepID=A0ABM6J9X1_NEIMU|nr:hypothetical protein A6J88_02640 [Neisseria mucosa]